MGAELRDHRRPPPGLARVQADVQRTVDAGEVRLSESSPSATRFRRAGRGRVEVITFKPLSKNPGALQACAATGRYGVPSTHRPLSWVDSSCVDASQRECWLSWTAAGLDQLSFNYAAWKTDLPLVYLPGNFRANAYFRHTRHTARGAGRLRRAVTAAKRVISGMCGVKPVGTK